MKPKQFETQKRNYELGVEAFFAGNGQEREVSNSRMMEAQCRFLMVIANTLLSQVEIEDE